MSKRPLDDLPEKGEHIPGEDYFHWQLPITRKEMNVALSGEKCPYCKRDVNALYELNPEDVNQFVIGDVFCHHAARSYVLGVVYEICNTLKTGEFSAKFLLHNPETGKETTLNVTNLADLFQHLQRMTKLYHTVPSK